jgi:hypothetical protein
MPQQLATRHDSRRFVGIPGAPRLFGGRCRAGLPPLMKWAGRRLLFHQRQHRAEPFALSNRAELHALGLDERTVILNELK